MVHELFGWIYFTLVGIVVTSGSIFLIYPLAEKLGLIDHPNLARKKHGTAVPVIGGLAIAVGLLIFQLCRQAYSGLSVFGDFDTGCFGNFGR